MWSSLHHQNWGPNHNKWDVSCRKLKMTSHPVQPESWTYPSIDVDIGWVDKLRKCIIQTGRSGYMVPQNPSFCGFTRFTPFLAAPKYEPNILEPWQNLRLGHQIGSLSRRSRSQISPAGDAEKPHFRSGLTPEFFTKSMNHQRWSQRIWLRPHQNTWLLMLHQIYGV